MSNIQEQRVAPKKAPAITQHMYFSMVPEDQVFAHVDGHQYANISHAYDGARIVHSVQMLRMVRADSPQCFVKDGVVYVWFATLGSAIAQGEELPEGVSILIVEKDA